MLNREFIENEWIPALEGGDYQKGGFSLCNDLGQYCCLGVACELLVAKGLIQRKQAAKGLATAYGDNYSNALESFLPDTAAEYIGITSEGEYKLGGEFNTLARLNDQSATFEPVIATMKQLLDNNDGSFIVPTTGETK